MATTADTPRNPNSPMKMIWETFQIANPKIRIRDAAEILGVKEVELLATSCGENVVRLQGEWSEIVRHLAELGPVMALTRNAHAVSEKHGTFNNIKFHGHMGLVMDEGGIDLRLFMHHWHVGFAVETEGLQGTLRSFQFFDCHGTALHKVYLTEQSEKGAYNQLTAEYASRDQTPCQSVEPVEPVAPDRPDAEIDVTGLEAAWNTLEDTHDFQSLLGRFGVGRVQALRLVDEGLACQVRPSALREVLHMAAQNHIPIMVFVGSPGVIQIHSGVVSNIKSTGSWINVLDDRFNLHVRQDQIASAWVVCKPTRNGIVWSLELYDNKGETIALLFANRKEGEVVLQAWTSVLSSLLPGRRPTQ